MKIDYENIEKNHLANHYLKIAILSGCGLGRGLGRGLGCGFGRGFGHGYGI